MKITRSTAIHGTLRPAAVNVLGQIPSEVLFHVQHQLRHPESIYSLSLEKVGQAFCNVATAYLSKTEEYRCCSSGTLEVSELLKLQEDFLRAMQEHLDDCWLILKTLVDPASAHKQRSFAEEYVIENKLPGAKSFRDAIVDYKNSLFIANKLKHQQGRLRGVAIWLSNSTNLGYFLEEPDSQGCLGPSPEIHPDRGAFSFARDLGFHFFSVYSCSEKLVRAVQRVLDAKGKSIQNKAKGGDWAQVLELMAKIPPYFFPKELARGIVGFQFDQIGQSLSMHFPEHPRVKYPTTITTTCSTVVDEHSLTFNVPFP